jgi:nucleoside-diphosphate-sugar epimerase
MRIFIAGATGALGRPVVRILLAHGHDLVGLTRSPERARALASSGVRPVVGNALDGETLEALVAAERPDQVLHLLTALPPGGPQRKSQLTATNELRTKGTANLIRAAIAGGAHRLVAESFVAVYGSVPAGHRIAEDEPLPPVGSRVFAETIEALRWLEAQLEQARSSGRLTTVAMRIGLFYGSDVPATQELVRQARAGRLFVPRDFTGVGPFVHVDDAARAIVAAIEHPHPSAVYNVADDEPVPFSTFVAGLAAKSGAPRARHVPAWLVRLVAPVIAELGTATLMVSNERIKRELGWTLRYPTIDTGLAEAAGPAAEAA